MVADVALTIPFRSRISPDAARARTVCLQWPVRMGLLVTDAAINCHRQADYAQLAARFHPRAAGEDLDLGVDQVSWIFLFDDLFGAVPGQDPRRVQDVAGAALDVLAGDRVVPESPISTAFADLWRRSCHGMSSTWQRRAARHWHDYLIGHVHKTGLRARRWAPTSDQHQRLRLDTIGVQLVLDMAERVGGFEVATDLFDTAELVEMRQIAAEIAGLHNDICSLGKEQAVGDTHNLVLILQHEQRVAQHEAVSQIADMVKHRIDRFLRLEGVLPTCYDQLRLTPGQRTDADRYVREALRTIMRGGVDWARKSSRYNVATCPRR